MPSNRFRTRRPRIPPSILLREEKRREEESKPILGRTTFTAQRQDFEADVRSQTIGLVQLDDFQRIKTEQQSIRRAEFLARKQSGNILDDDADDVERERKRLSKIKKNQLSFADDVDEDLDDDNDSHIVVVKKVGKDPTVNTSFLPDITRAEEESKFKDEARRKWLDHQELIKEEMISVPFSYFDGSTHAEVMNCRFGDLVSKFLLRVRQQFERLQAVPVENLMYVIQGVIIPHHYTFYELVLNKSRGSQGLFFPEAHLEGKSSEPQKNDETTEPGRVVEKSWYVRHKHVFPASQWEEYQPLKHSSASASSATHT